MCSTLYMAGRTRRKKKARQAEENLKQFLPLPSSSFSRIFVKTGQELTQLTLSSKVRNIWFLSFFIPSKREKHIQSETT